MDKHIAFEMRGITKRFGDFTANDNINLTVYKGEVHAILGENGAGKTTLMNILYGLLKPTQGELYIGGRQVTLSDPGAAIAHGIGMVHQHFMLVQPFTVYENIVLGLEPAKLGVIDRKKARKRVSELSKTYGLSVNPDELVSQISVGMQQRVELIKTLYRGADILILDEPTAVLTPQEITELGVIINNLTKEGKSVVLITHKLNEIKNMADRCTIIRKGHVVGTVDVSDVTEVQLASMMVGREVVMQVPKSPANRGAPALVIENLHVNDAKGIAKVRGLSLSLHRGEILGIAGIDGNGQTELIEALTGLRKPESGKILVIDSEKSSDIAGSSPKNVISHKVAHIPEDRQRRGLVLDFSVGDNIVLELIDKLPYSRRGIIRQNAISAYAQKLVDLFDVRPPKTEIKAGELSGGNQQKVIIAREISNNPNVLIAAQPTRGLDVGAIEYVQRALISQRDEGKAILLVSLELDEILNVADRIAVIHQGHIVAIIDGAKADKNEIGLLMAGGNYGQI